MSNYITPAYAIAEIEPEIELHEGDRVRVQVDCTMTVIGSQGFLYADLDEKRHFAYDLDCLRVLDAKVEKVETFRPGDLVRSRATGQLFLLGETGSTQLSRGDDGWSVYRSDLATTFPPSGYERVVAP